MKFIRIIKSEWGRKLLPNGKPNPNFKEVIQGLDVLEGTKFTPDFLKEKNNSGYNIYYFPNRPSKNVYTKEIIHLNGKMIDDFQYVFVDMDLKDGKYKSKAEFISKVGEFPLRPTRIVDSGHGIHVYWGVSNLDRKYYICLQLQLLNFFKTDPSVWTVLQLMRLPGYKNTKDFDASVECFTIEENKVSYTAQELARRLPKMTAEQKTKARLHVDRLEGKVSIDVSNWEGEAEALPDKFLDLLKANSRINNLFRHPEIAGGASKRSGADMKLAHLIYTEGYSYREVCTVISNTQKAISKGASKEAYVRLTVDSVFGRRKDPTIQTVTEFLNSEGTKLEPKINGPYYLDAGVLGEPWRRKEILGIISGSGIGKTAYSLNIILQTIRNNKDTDDVYVFISLEMTKRQIIKRWVSMVGATSPLADRLYVIDTINKDNMQEMVGLQEIYKACSIIKQQTSKHIGMVIIDHLHILSTHINTKVTPSFGIDAEGGTGYGTVRNLSITQLATQLNALVVMLDTFLVVLSQTTKIKGAGDIPIFKDGCFGVSNFDWICSRIISIWQPLLRVQSKTSLRVLAYHYAKIRELHGKDQVAIYDPHLLTFDIKTGTLGHTTPEEYQVFIDLLPLAAEERKRSTSHEDIEYST